jgi:hemerythrin superfamily protein
LGDELQARRPWTLASDLLLGWCLTGLCAGSASRATTSIPLQEGGRAENTGNTIVKRAPGKPERVAWRRTDPARFVRRASGEASFQPNEEDCLEMNILDVLHADHATVTNLFSELKRAAKPAQKRELFDSLRSELEVHMRAEEGIFYPEVERIGPPAAAAIATALEQHGDTMVLLTELVRLDPASSEFKSRLEKMETGVNKHIQHEESKIFGLVRQHFGNLLDDLGNRVKHREDALKAGGQIAGSE